MALTVIYMSIRQQLPAEVITSLAGMAIGFFVAARQNGEERQHLERMRDLKNNAE